MIAQAIDAADKVAKLVGEAQSMQQLLGYVVAALVVALIACVAFIVKLMNQNVAAVEAKVQAVESKATMLERVVIALETVKTEIERKRKEGS